MADIKMALQAITLAKALKVKNRLAGRLAKVQTDIETYNSVLEGQADQVNVLVLVKTREELVDGLVTIKTAISEANREIQRAIYDLAEKKASVQFLNGINTRHCAQPAVYPGQPDHKYVATLKKADVDAQVQRLEKEIDALQDQIDSFNHAHTVAVDGRILELAS
jgi:DNA repair exonuclease SbcCD ATPase subunit